MLTTKIDLMPFCDREPAGRYDLSKPFARGEFVYATDGRICVRVPDTEYEVDPEPRKTPDVTGLKFIDAPDAEWKEFQQPFVIEDNSGRWSDDPCPFCRERWVKCDQCNGEGWIAGKRKKAIECPKCEGEGDCLDGDGKCENCDSTRDAASTVKIDDTKFDVYFLWKIVALPNVKYAFIESSAIETCPKTKELYMPLSFRFDGGCGLLMPKK